jgi:RNA polymerase sigma-54 factor
MKQSLQLKIGQQLTMTPQLQQAIRLLQLSTLDLQQEIQQAIESNPMLEIVEDEHAGNGLDTEFEDGDPMLSLRKQESEPGMLDDGGIDGGVADVAEIAEWNNDIPDELPVDSNWDDVYESSLPPTSGSGSDDDGDYDFESRNSTAETLQDHLLWQLNLTPMSDTDRLIAMAVIDAVDPNGMLTCTPEEILSGFDPELGIELDEVEAVRHRIQHFDPVGVASLDLRECLLVQLRQLSPDTPALDDAILIVDKYLTLLGNHDYAQLMRRTKLKEPQLKEALRLIKQMNPRPGEFIDNSETEYIAPDVFVRKQNGRWVVELNPDIAPRLRINSDYASLIRRADSSADNTYLRDNLQEARWFLKSLQSRNETLMKVATRIVEHQRGFLDYGEEAMKPLVLHDIAEDVQMHESTISRVTTRKYMHTPRGIFELKYFFSSHVSTTGGGECSSTAIRAMIKKLVSSEDPRKPLSDSSIVELLEAQGIQVARRTIAKYREALSIPPSNERKRLV